MVAHWARAGLALLARQLPHLLGPQFPVPVLDSCCSNLLELEFTLERTAHTFHRLLHILGDIAELTQPELFVPGQPALQSPLLSPVVCQPSLATQPEVFYKAVVGLGQMVQAFLGLSRGGVAHPARPRTDPLLHLFAFALFPAALVDTEYSGLAGRQAGSEAGRWAAGRTEALETLCILMRARRPGENVATAYTGRFLLAVKLGLQAGPETRDRLVASLADLMTTDLPGVNLVVPDICVALQAVLAEQGGPGCVELRRQALLLATTILALPAQYPDLVPAALGPARSSGPLAALAPPLFSSLLAALHTEQDTTNSRLLVALLYWLGCQQDSTVAGQDWAGQVVGLACCRLVSSWAGDLQTSLAVLELVAGLAGDLHPATASCTLVCSNTVTGICNFIAGQCSQPPPAHTRYTVQLLHTALTVAATGTCTAASSPAFTPAWPSSTAIPSACCKECWRWWSSPYSAHTPGRTRTDQC